MIFKNRKHAGQLLARKLAKYKGTACVVLALPRGGVPVAAEIAASLGVTMQVLLVRKIGAPFEPEVALGAICEDEDPFWNSALLAEVGISPADLHNVVENERAKIQAQRTLFRAGTAGASAQGGPPIVRGKIVMVVDDGLATGATMMAAVKYLQIQGARAIVAVVPVAAENALRNLHAHGVETVTLESPRDLQSVGQWYADFTQVPDVEVVASLRRGLNKPESLSEDKQN